MQATINISLDVPQTYQLDTLKNELTEYAKKLVAKAMPNAARKHYSKGGIAKTNFTDDCVIDSDLQARIELAREEHRAGNYVRCSDSKELQNFLDSL